MSDGKACPFPLGLRNLFWSFNHSFSLTTIMDFIFRAATIHPSNHFPSLQASRLHSGTSLHTHFHFLLFTTAFLSLFLLYMLFFLLVWKLSLKGTSFPCWVQVREKKKKLGCFRIGLNFQWTELNPMSASQRSLISKFRFFCYRFPQMTSILKHAVLLLKGWHLSKQLLLKNINIVLNVRFCHWMCCKWTSFTIKRFDWCLCNSRLM